jgi:hypothetical protein
VFFLAFSLYRTYQKLERWDFRSGLLARNDFRLAPLGPNQQEHTQVLGVHAK